MVGKNIEIKAAIERMCDVEKKAVAIGAHGPFILHQKDVYFKTPIGRLKARYEDNQQCELIFYFRGDNDKPMESLYYRKKIKSGSMLFRVLESFLGIAKTVNKTRTLYLYKNARIHLDIVDKLGMFVEIEVVQDKNYEHDGVKLANDLLNILGIDHAKLLKQSYSDMVE